ncbi:MAG: Cyclic di-GMP phosphodiesterase response regulator RpfG, partial [Chloroflexi bacterium]|nr:Cyclic di-GMP phosphodiesterase response regulator RpfG [Chloroflexota bacterium]
HEALAKLQLDVDLVVLDAAMPGMDGFQLTRNIRQDRQHGDVPIIMLTGSGSQKDRLRAVEAGVNDFVTKPFEINEIRLRSASLLGLKEATDTLKRNGAELERKVEERNAALRAALEDMAAAQRRTQEAHLDTIRRLVLAAEYKHRDTAAHIERIGRYCEMIAQRLNLPPSEIEILRYASPMHDVGKIGIPDGILMKPGKLSGDEWQIMRTHPAIGAHILRGSRSPVMQAGEIIALTHHEKFDGSGYPAGLSGDRIPLHGRICAVADVFDALTTNREYRDALSSKTVCGMLESEAGHHFDPEIVRAFLEDRREVDHIKTEFEELGAAGTANWSQGRQS